jgi:peptidoglycan/LPS O-acetylase OafA/YrhL
MPNVAVALACLPSLLVPLWSVGVEEQFYLAWPVFIKYSKRVLPVLVLIIVLYLSIKFTVRFTGPGKLYALISLTRIDCMAIGGLGAWWVNSRRIGQRLLFNQFTQAASWVVFFIACLGPISIPDFIRQEFYAGLFIVIILNVSMNAKPLLGLENSTLDWVGKISYGIYLLHLPVMYLVSKVMPIGLSSLPGGFFLYVVICLTVTLLMASVSYNYFERYFIHLKARYTVLKTTKSAFVPDTTQNHRWNS